jgi:hypothetical protein
MRDVFSVSGRTELEYPFDNEGHAIFYFSFFIMHHLVLFTIVDIHRRLCVTCIAEKNAYIWYL